MIRGLTVLLLAGSVLPADAVVVPPAATNNRASIAWDQEVVIPAPECTQTFVVSPRESLCIVAVTPDGAGGLHLFLTLEPLGTGKKQQARIRHFLLAGGVVREMPPVPSVNAGVKALKATTGPQGEVTMVWVEDEYWDPQYQPSMIYLRQYKDETWTAEPTLVLDDKGDVFVLGSGSLALWSNPDGSRLVYWDDTREYHFAQDFLTMGHAGNVRKTYLRRFTADGAGTVERVQKRGYFEPDAFRLLPRPGGEPDVLWTESGAIKRSSRGPRRWSEEEVVARCTSSPGQPHVLDLEVAPGTGEVPQVAWVCSRYETTEPGTSKNSHFSDLYITTRREGTWRTGERLSRSVSSFRWLSGDPERTFLLLRESRPGRGVGSLSPWVPAPVSLTVKTIEYERAVASETISDRALGDLLEAATEPDGSVHVIYADLVSKSEAALKYRRGSLRPN